MRIVFAFALILITRDTGIAQSHKNLYPFPTEIVIARDSFIDIGPPFNYYDLTFLRSEGEKTKIERVSLTPPADLCYPHAEIKVAHISLNESLPSILQGTNPCGIPEKALKAELRRRSKGQVFRGMNVSIQVQCAGKTGVIRADILDRDIFDAHPNTPQYTAWSRSLFEKLDKATGESPWDKPIFAVSEAVAPSQTPQSAALQAIADGRFDAVFGDAPDRPSALYRLAQNAPRQPFIELTDSQTVRPVIYVDPVYPPIARAARVEGTIEFHAVVGSDGLAENISIDSGPKLLWQTVSEAVEKWKFSKDDSGKSVRGSIRFGLNCASE
ncbi:MAG: energy transducer TonB, partial [Terracidiphilus sp.]